MENRAVSAWQGCREASHSIFPQEAQEMFGMVRNCRAAGQFSAWRRWHLAIGILASLMVSSCAPEPATLVTSPTLTATRTPGAPTESPGPAATIAPRTPAADTEGEIVARTLTGHTADVTSLAWSPDGTILASGSSDSTIRLWNTKTGKQVHRLEADYVLVMTWSPDGAVLASGSADGTVTLWDTETGEKVHTLEGPPGICTAFTHGVFDIAWSPDGTKLISASDTLDREGEVVIWDALTGEALHTLSLPSVYYSLAWSPDGTMIASVADDGTVVLWDAETIEPIHTLDVHEDIHSVIWSPDGMVLAFALLAGKVILWAPEGPEPLRILHVQVHNVLGVVFRLDGMAVALITDDDTMILWNVETGEPLRTLPLRTLEGYNDERVQPMALSPDGKMLAAGMWDGTVVVWELTP